MQTSAEHQFDHDQNQAVLRLSEELWRFSVATGVVGMALVGLGIAATITAPSDSMLAGPAIIVLGLVAMFGGMLFLRPRTSFNWIARSSSGNVTRLIDALRYLDSAHTGLRILLVLFLLARLGAFAVGRIS